MRFLEPEMDINTFSFISEDKKFSEESWVDLVNGHVNATSFKISSSSDDCQKDFDHLISALGEPFGTLSIYAQHKVFQLAKNNNIKVMLDGQGADEMLAGYYGYPAKRLRTLLEKKDFIGAISFLSIGLDGLTDLGYIFKNCNRRIFWTFL